MQAVVTQFSCVGKGLFGKFWTLDNIFWLFGLCIGCFLLEFRSGLPALVVISATSLTPELTRDVTRNWARLSSPENSPSSSPLLSPKREANTLLESQTIQDSIFISPTQPYYSVGPVRQEPHLDFVDIDGSMVDITSFQNKKAKHIDPHVGSSAVNLGLHGDRHGGAPSAVNVDAALPSLAVPAATAPPNLIDIMAVLQTLVNQGTSQSADLTALTSRLELSTLANQANLMTFREEVSAGFQADRRTAADLAFRLDGRLECLEADLSKRFETLETKFLDLRSTTTTSQADLKTFVENRPPLATSGMAASAMGLGPASSGGSAKLPRAATFVPQVAYLRGWSPFAKDFSKRVDGIDSDEADSAVAAILQHLPQAVAAMLARHLASSFRNYQIVFFFKPEVSGEDIHKFSAAVNNAQRTHELLIKGKPFFCQVEQPDWKKARNLAMRQAEAAIVATASSPLSLKLDYPSGSIWVLCEPPLQIGYYHVKRSKWLWNSPGVGAVRLDLPRLCTALDTELLGS